MEKTSHSGHAHKNIHEISKKLQSEVDVILANVDEKMLYAEFRENEIFDIQNGDKQEVVRHTLEERIMIRPHQRSVTMERIERTTNGAAAKIGRARRLFHYLFKPLEY
jgi:L-ascorbate metabolism protein UlaG (beta-lactamase superfamily)